MKIVALELNCSARDCSLSHQPPSSKCSLGKEMPTGILQAVLQTCVEMWIYEAWVVDCGRHGDTLRRSIFKERLAAQLGGVSACNLQLSACSGSLSCRELAHLRSHPPSEQPTSLPKQSRNIKVQPLQPKMTHYEGIAHSRASCIRV